MAISLVAVGQKWTASIANAIIAAVNAIGSNVVTPTSVAGTGVSLSGAKVVVSAASAASVNGCFTSTYDWYVIEYSLTTSGAATLSGALRLSGTDASSAYDNQRLYAQDATATSGQLLNNAGFRWSTHTIAGKNSGTVKLYDPAIAVATQGTVVQITSANPMTSTTGSMFTNGFSHRTLTAYDGFTITPSTGTITGTIRIYGMG